MIIENWSIFFLGQHVHTGEEVAIKLEPAATKYPQLYYEAKLYKVFDGAGMLNSSYKCIFDW